GDQVKLADVIAMAAGDDDIAEAVEIAGGGILAAATQRLGGQQHSQFVLQGRKPTHGDLKNQMSTERRTAKSESPMHKWIRNSALVIHASSFSGFGGFFLGGGFALAETDGFADAVAEVVQLGPAGHAAALDINLGDLRRVQRE